MKAHRVSLMLRRQLSIFQVLLLVVATFAVVVQARADPNVNASKTKPVRRLPLINNSTVHVGLDHRLPVSVININTINLETVTPPVGVQPGAEYPFETYTGAAFQVYELPDSKTGKCRKTCRSAEFIIPAGMDAEIVIQPDFSVTVTDATIYAQQLAKEALEECCNLPSGNDQDQVEACLLEGTAKALHTTTAEWKYQQRSLQKLGKQLEGYICNAQSKTAEPEPETSPALGSFQWESRDYIMHTVDILHKRPASQIHVIHNFIEPEECRAIQQVAAPQLRRAVVIDQATGGSKLSSERQAWQVPIIIPWELESQDQPQNNHPLTTLSRRVYDYTQHVLNLNITEHGQEPLMSVEYYGQDVYQNEDPSQPDQYTAHCDGSCDGRPHEPPGRVATMVMYCQTAKRGGHTHFANAGVHVRPAIGMGIFFSYINAAQKTMDTGLTEHSGCPVWKGHKHIVTQWVRLGVDDENPWDSYDSLGNLQKKPSGNAEESVME